MDLASFLGAVKLAASTATTLRKFIADEVGTLLEATGEASYSAAILAWHDAHRSHDPDKDIDDMRVLLRNAYEQFKAAGEPRGMLGAQPHALRRSSGCFRRMTECAVIISVCHRCRNPPEAENVKAWADRAREALSNHQIHAAMADEPSRSLLNWGKTEPFSNPVFVSNMISENTQLEQLLQALESL